MNSEQIKAMDDTMLADTGHHAQAYAKANLHHLQDACGVVGEEDRQQLLIRRIATRQGLLASGPLTEKARRNLEDANEMDAQELAIFEAEHFANSEASDLGKWMFWGACVILSSMFSAHFIATNWPA